MRSNCSNRMGFIHIYVCLVLLANSDDSRKITNLPLILQRRGFMFKRRNLQGKGNETIVTRPNTFHTVHSFYHDKNLSPRSTSARLTVSDRFTQEFYTGWKHNTKMKTINLMYVSINISVSVCIPSRWEASLCLNARMTAPLARLPFTILSHITIVQARLKERQISGWSMKKRYAYEYTSHDSSCHWQ